MSDDIYDKVVLQQKQSNVPFDHGNNDCCDDHGAALIRCRAFAPSSLADNMIPAVFLSIFCLEISFLMK